MVTLSLACQGVCSVLIQRDPLCRYRGSLDVSNVAFRGMGQTGTARAAVTVLTTAGTVALHDCTFSHCFGPGVDVRSAAAVNMTNNVVLDTEGPAVAVWNDPRRAPGVVVPMAPTAVLINNTAGFARKLGVDVVKDSVSGFVLCPYSRNCTVEAEGNVAAGSENYGFVFGRCALAVAVVCITDCVPLTHTYASFTGCTHPRMFRVFCSPHSAAQMSPCVCHRQRQTRRQRLALHMLRSWLAALTRMAFGSPSACSCRMFPQTRSKYIVLLVCLA